MFGPLYHIKHLFTSDATQIHDLNRLEFLSACTLLQDVNILQRLWPTIPVHFIKPLSKACVCKIFYIHYEEGDLKPNFSDEESIELILSLRYLIQNWPDEEFILEDILPVLYKPKRGLFCKRYNCIEIHGDKLASLMSMLLTDVIAPVLKESNSINAYDCTDYNFFLCKWSLPSIDEGIAKELTEMEENVNFENRKEFSVKFGCQILISDDNHYLYLSKMIQFTDKPYMIKLPTVSLDNIITKKRTRPHITQFFKMLSRTETKYLKICIGDFSDGTAQVLSKTLPNLRGLHIANNQTLTSLEFLWVFTELKHLGFYNVNLYGQLKHLQKLSPGLQYLELRECDLGNNDLVCLIESPHAVSLKQFEIELNNESEVEYFLKLCPHLVNIEVLTVESGQHLEIDTHLMKTLLNIVSVLPKLVILTLKVATSIEALLQHLSLVVRNFSLKVLSLKILIRYLLDSHRYDELEELAEKLQQRIVNACDVQNRKLEFNINLM